MVQSLQTKKHLILTIQYATCEYNKTMEHETNFKEQPLNVSHLTKEKKCGKEQKPQGTVELHEGWLTQGMVNTGRRVQTSKESLEE